jgi:hypothetical protein
MQFGKFQHILKFSEISVIIIIINIVLSTSVLDSLKMQQTSSEPNCLHHRSE